jgi:glyoxylase-like metal-dependent hydrolase (beta-lactamase superfamily II)
VTTHCHPDHFQALADVVAATGAKTYAASEEAPHIPVTTDAFLHDGQRLPLGSVNLRAVKLVGHKRVGNDHISSSLAVLYRDPDGSSHAFTGDSFFPGGVGNTCDDPAAYTQLLSDVTNKLFGKLPNHTVVYPGHGFDTTLGAERPSLRTWAMKYA